jgi:twitching motility protein PilT
MQPIETFLRALRDGDATALHLREGSRAFWRVGGELVVRGERLPEGEEFEEMILELLRRAGPERLPSSDHFHFGFVAAESRFRAHVFRSRDGLNAVLRRVPPSLPAPADLGLHPELAEKLGVGGGLVLASGPAHSGKSTTAAALFDWVGRSSARYVVVIDDPPEHEFSPQRSLVQRIEVGVDAPDAAAALRAALAVRPDAVFAGDLRDAEQLRLAIRCADEGALTFATLRADGAADATERLFELLPEPERGAARGVVASCLRMVVHQVLLRRAKGGGVVPAFEVLLGTKGVQALVREGRTHDLAVAMQNGAAQGMRTLEDAVDALVASGAISAAEAAALPRARAGSSPRG